MHTILYVIGSFAVYLVTKTWFLFTALWMGGIKTWQQFEVNKRPFFSLVLALEACLLLVISFFFSSEPSARAYLLYACVICNFDLHPLSSSARAHVRACIITSSPRARDWSPVTVADSAEVLM